MRIRSVEIELTNLEVALLQDAALEGWPGPRMRGTFAAMSSWYDLVDLANEVNPDGTYRYHLHLQPELGTGGLVVAGGKLVLERRTP